uniref:Uncharacterized protein n=1 Tax=Magallana gigas TaxID=29159 RepID=K1PFR9_MAGGI
MIYIYFYFLEGVVMVECEGTVHTTLLSPVLVGSLCLSMQVTASAPDDSERHFSCFAQLIEVVCGKFSLSLLYCSTVPTTKKIMMPPVTIDYFFFSDADSGLLTSSVISGDN